MVIRAYLRVSTSEQDASRARRALKTFAKERDLRIAGRYVENESGAKLHRPELFRLLDDCEPGDVLLVEQVDRLSRLTAPDWQKLRTEIDAKQVRIVVLDLPTSWTLAAPSDEFTGRMFAAVTSMTAGPSRGPLPERIDFYARQFVEMGDDRLSFKSWARACLAGALPL